VFQNYALYPHMDVAQNMSFALELAGVEPAEIRRRVDDAAQVLNIGHLLQRKPKELSGGQRQRVAIGRCIVREPAVFLFDEPLSNLDAKLRAHMRTELTLLHQRLGKTTIYVTHDQVEAMTLASRIVIFDKGHIQQVGTPSDVFNRPANLFVAGFIGMPSMNLLDGRVRRDGGRCELAGPGFAFPLATDLPAGTELVAGVRPQSLLPVEGAGYLALRVEVVEYLGMESLLIGRLTDGSDIQVTAVLPGQRSDLLHRTVPLVNDPQALHVFDKATGRRVGA
jgi:multiple sugar transport system ATP-binding protein